MREIKFRAWDKDHFIHINASGGAFMYHNVNFKGDIKDMIMQQYIGLKDKNGIDVYEGDIISTGNINWQILWDVRKAQFAPHTIDDITTSTHVSSGVWPMRDFNWLDLGRSINLQKVGTMGKVVEVEVIGNIYENPELVAQQSSEELKGSTTGEKHE